MVKAIRFCLQVKELHCKKFTEQTSTMKFSKIRNKFENNEDNECLFINNNKYII